MDHRRLSTSGKGFVRFIGHPATVGRELGVPFVEIRTVNRATGRPYGCPRRQWSPDPRLPRRGRICAAWRRAPWQNLAPLRANPPSLPTIPPGTASALVVRVALPLVAYDPRAPERRVLCALVRDHLETFLAQAAHARDGEPVLRFVEREFRTFSVVGTSPSVSRGFLAGPAGPTA